MGQRGPAPVPTSILEARGSWRAKAREGEPRLRVKAPTCPAWLGTEAKAEWRRQVKHLVAMGVLAEVDRAMLTAYCEAWSEFVQAVELLKTAGLTITTDKGIVMQHPFVAIKNKAAERLAKFGQQFGFTPASRTRLRASEEAKDEANPKARFFAASAN